jgi:DNA repair photolyase
MFSIKHEVLVPSPLRPMANPPNPWATREVEYLDGEAPSAALEVYEDRTRGILAHNNSPDVGFSWSVNPYRGCFHACAYCYARPTHEYLSFGAGTDFERKIVVKTRAAELLREAFDEPKWTGELVAFSGVTDCYQPLEASYRLTRGCLEACAEYRNPAAIITKSPLVERDVDVLQALARSAHLAVTVSIPFWDESKARAMEPFVTTPARRLRIIERLARARLRVGVMVAPIIPGLNDEDIGDVLRAARDAGASWAGSVLLRLPGPVKEVFEERLRLSLPLRAERVLSRIRQTRGGRMYDPRYDVRGKGEGAYAAAIQALFEQTAKAVGLETRSVADDAITPTFARPRGQLPLF